MIAFVGDAKDSNVPLPEPQPKKPRSKWHFGIRSRSPPMEIMLELYRTLQALGMEWRQRPELEKTLQEKKEKGESNSYDDATKGQDLFFLETRWKVGEVLVRMDLQLYRVDANNYLVDFRNVGYALLDDSGDQSHEQEGGGGGDSDFGEQLHGAMDKAAEQAASLSKAQDQRKAKLNPKPSLAPAVPTGRKEVCSPFFFLECATRLM